MITGPAKLDGQRTPLQDLETLYIGGAEPAVIRVGFGRPVPMIEVPVARRREGSESFENGTLVTGPNQVYARLSKEANDHDGSYHPGVGSRKQARG